MQAGGPVPFQVQERLVRRLRLWGSSSDAQKDDLTRTTKLYHSIGWYLEGVGGKSSSCAGSVKYETESISWI